MMPQVWQLPLVLRPKFVVIIRVCAAADAISLAQTAEGSYDEMTNNLQCIRELSIQADNATNSSTDRGAIQTEITDLKSEIERVTHTQFNGVEVIGQDAGLFYFQVGPNGDKLVDGITVKTVDITGETEFSAMQTSKCHFQ